MGRVAVVCPASSARFIPPIEAILRREHEVRVFDADGAIAADQWADAVWCEWAGRHAAALAAYGRKPLVVRLHRYEADEAFFGEIRFDRLTLVSTSEHVLARARLRADVPRAVVIPSIVDFGRFVLRPHQDTARVGIVADIHGRKQLGLALQVLAALPAGVTMHHAGATRDPALARYLVRMTRFLGLEDRVTWHGEIPPDRMPGFWSDKAACLSTSADEGCPYNVVEAMACGVEAVVHWHEGAERLGASLWSSIPDAASALLTAIETPRLAALIRSAAESAFSIEENADDVLALFRR